MKCWRLVVCGLELARVELQDSTPPDTPQGAPDALSQPIGYVGPRIDQGVPYA